MGTRLEAAAGVRGDVRSLAFSVIAASVAVIGAKCAIIMPYRVVPGYHRGFLGIVRATCVWEVAVGSRNFERTDADRTRRLERGRLKQSHERI